MKFRLATIHPVLFLLPIFLLVNACGNSADQTYTETFDSTGKWSTGSDSYTEGQISDGVYDFLVKDDDLSRWASAGENFSDGVYQVEATQVEGPIDNGFGMIFRANTNNGDFYLFKISGDGYVWIGQFQDEVEGEPIIGDHWFQSPAVKQGLNQTNTLRVQAESGNMIFFVNDQEVGRVTDSTFDRGDIGLFAQTLGAGGVRVHFDNFSVSPIIN